MRLATIGLLIAVAFAAAVRLGPLPKGLLDTADDVSTVVVDRNGRPLYEARSGGGLRTARLAASDLPDTVVQATIAAEDRRFRRHLGLDPIALGRAVASNARALRVVQGASTITQQTARLLLERRAGRPRPRTVWNKLVEAVVALRLERRLSKDEILAMYLSLAPYGNQIAGITRASEVYFGVRPEALTVAQAAFLAGLPQRPSSYDPLRDARAARSRQRAVIERLRKGGRIDGAQAEQARREELRFLPLPHAFTAPHFVEMVLAGSGTRRPARIATTLDAELQAEVAGILEARRDELLRHGAHNVAVAVLDNERGEWLAWEGSGGYDDGEHGGAIDGVRALRQPGSALKPFTYALSFETGDTPATVLPDIQSTYPTAQPGVVYAPRNYDSQFHGPLRARKALAGSQNVPAVALASRVGVPDLLRFLRANGFTSFDRTASHYGLGLSLGNAEVSLAELVAGYSDFARGGVYLEPRAVLGARDARPPRRVMSERSAFWVTDVLSDEDARAYVFGRGGSLDLPFPVAVKTGTSQAYHDNWTVGYTREVTVGVWVGNFDRQPLTGSSGVTGAGPIFHAVMLAAQRHVGHEAADAAIVDRPVDLTEHVICELSGMRAGAACPRRVREWLPAGTSPVPCSWHHQSEDGLLTLWPEEYRSWAASHGLLDAEGPFRNRTEAPRVVMARDEGRHPQSSAPPELEIVSPPNGGTYLIDPTLRAEFQTLPFKAVSARGRVEWRVDDRPLGSTGADQPLHWSLVRGTHVVTARDASGRTARAAILVK